MCGIAGFLTDGEPVLGDSLIASLCDRLAHRGPDGSGYFCKGTVALGHRRLSIIDVAGGVGDSLRRPWQDSIEMGTKGAHELFERLQA